MSDLLDERRTGLGGSDIASLFNTGWGCRKRLWYEKSGVEPDFPRDSTEAMELGKILEPYWLKRYCKVTGLPVIKASETGLYRHPGVDCLLVHVDGVVMDPARGPGALEIKSVGSAAWWKYKRDGLPVDYSLQLQHGINLVRRNYQGTKVGWGSFGIGNREDGRLTTFDVEFDLQLATMIELEGAHFWKTLGNPDLIPETLEPDDRRCQRCEHRVKCQGEALINIGPYKDLQPDESLRPLRDEYIERRQMRDEAKALLDETAAQLQEAIGTERKGAAVGDGKVYSYKHSVERMNVKSLIAAYEKCRTELLGKIEEADGIDVASQAAMFIKSAESFKETSTEDFFRVY